MAKIVEEYAYNGAKERIARLGLTPVLEELRAILIRGALERGEIDVGVLVVPSDGLGVFLTDRGPRMADAKKHVRAARADDLPWS